MAIYRSSDKAASIYRAAGGIDTADYDTGKIFQYRWPAGTVLYTESNPQRYMDATSYQYNNATLTMSKPLTKVKTGIKVYLAQIANVSVPCSWSYVQITPGTSYFTNANPITIPLASLKAGFTTQITADISAYSQSRWDYQFPTSFKMDASGNLTVSNTSDKSYQTVTILDASGQRVSAEQKGLTIGMFSWVDRDGAGHTAQFEGTATAMIDRIEAY